MVPICLSFPLEHSATIRPTQRLIELYAGPIPTLVFQSLSSKLRSITGPNGPCLSENSRSRSETSLPVSQGTSLVSCSSGNATILTPRAIAG